MYIRLYIILAIYIHELLIHQQFDDLLRGKARAVHGHYSSRFEGKVLDRSQTWKRLQHDVGTGQGLRLSLGFLQEYLRYLRDFGM